jgi:hypothetical protein
MEKHEATLANGSKVQVEITEVKGGVSVVHRVIAADGTAPLSTHVTCTCGSGSSAKTVSKDCPKEGNTCDCSDPANPKITCA